MGKATWQQIAYWLILILAASGAVTYTDLFGTLFQLKGIDYTYTGDIVCGETCESYINVTTDYWRVCFEHPEDSQKIIIPGKYSLATSTIGESPDTVLYKKSNRGRTLWVNLNNVDNVVSTAPDVPVEWLVPTYGNDWRPLKDGDCWDRNKINKIKLVGEKSPEETVKWGFLVDEYVDIDPVWMSPPIEIQFYDENVACTDNCISRFKVSVNQDLTPQIIRDMDITLDFENLNEVKRVNEKATKPNQRLTKEVTKSLSGTIASHKLSYEILEYTGEDCYEEMQYVFPDGMDFWDESIHGPQMQELVEICIPQYRPIELSEIISQLRKEGDTLELALKGSKAEGDRIKFGIDIGGTYIDPYWDDEYGMDYFTTASTSAFDLDFNVTI